MTTTPTPGPLPLVETPPDSAIPRPRTAAAFGPAQLLAAVPGAFRKLDPRLLVKTPVMFIVAVGALFTTVLAVVTPSAFAFLIAGWLWLTVLFANLAESVAEGRGKAQAASLKGSRAHSIATRLDAEDHPESIPATQLRRGDRVLVVAGETIPGDGDVIEGAATVDESAVTGESAPVIRESGGDRCAVTGGTRVLSDHIVIRITSDPGETFIDRMIGLVEGASRQKTPNEVALNILLAVLSIIFVLVVITISPLAAYSGAPQSMLVLTALLVCLIPTTIGALLSAIGIAGMDRLVQRNVLAMSGRAVEAAGDVTTLLLDKTGTITEGDRRATEFSPLPGVDPTELARAARSSSLADETPEGRSIVALAEEVYRVTEDSSHDRAEFIPFSARTRMSALVWPGGDRVVKGASREVLAWVEAEGGEAPVEATDIATAVANEGGTTLLVAERRGERVAVLGVITLSDIVKPGIAERFARLRQMGIKTVMITGDNELTARAIAYQAGVDDYLAEATPEDKLALIRSEQEGGRLVAMTGDGTNDAPALAQADVGVAMNTGTSAAKEAGNMVDLDSDPTKLIEIVEIGKQLLITRGALTTFSIANDVAKYFAVIPAMFMVAIPGLGALNIMGLHSPETAILSAVIFNALIIIALIPLSLRGVRYRALSASKLLGRNLLVFGLGGLIAPFIGIKVIDLALSLIPALS